MKKIQGMTASEGIAIGKTYLFHKGEIVFPKSKIKEKEIAGEKEEYKRVISECVEDLRQIKCSSEEQKEIFEAHVMLLKDSSLKESIFEKLEGRHNLAHAVELSLDQMIETFLNMEDPYFRERAHDFQDIKIRLLCKILELEMPNLEHIPEDSIIVANELTPSDTSTMDTKNIKGLLIDRGGKTSHVSLIAQTYNIPCLVGMKNITKLAKDGEMVILDGLEGLAILSPEKEELEEYEKTLHQLEKEEERLSKYRKKVVETKDGTKIKIGANIGSVDSLDRAIHFGANHIGLLRTEFIYMERNCWPSEEVQFEAYKEIAQSLEDEEIIIRTLDIGGDKDLPYFEFPNEDNPFLGFRGIRISLEEVQRFKEQLRAILRASHYGGIKILLPMIISIEEIQSFKEILNECMDELREQEIPFNEKIEIGLMIETPASALLARDFIQEVDFLSIGTNDLIQYTLATDRGNEKIQDLFTAYHPAILRMIEKVLRIGQEEGKAVGMCGGFAADDEALELLIGLGLREFSVPAGKIPKMKEKITEIDLEKAEELKDKVLCAKTREEILTILEGEKC